jgi:beta-lactamase class A
VTSGQKITTQVMRDLEEEIREVAAPYSGRWTCALTDLTGGGHIAIDEDEVMPTGSLIKVGVLVALYHAAHDGRFRLDDRTSYRVEHYCRGSGVLQHLSPGVEMAIRDAAVLMMTISDNAATNMCVDLAGIAGINETMRSLGLPVTSVLLRWGDPRGAGDNRKMHISTAGEMCRLLELIAKHEAVSVEASEDMLRIMRRCNGRAELSRNLPWNELNMLPRHDDNWVAEKGGAYMNGVRTGGSIFHGPRGTFAMSVFCEGGVAFGTAHNAEGNVLLGNLGEAAWRRLARGE